MNNRDKYLNNQLTYSSLKLFLYILTPLITPVFFKVIFNDYKYYNVEVWKRKVEPRLFYLCKRLRIVQTQSRYKMKEPNPRYPKPLKTWLIIGLIMVLGQVVIGGITRLTGSGLSITKWEIVTGTLPPMGEQAWLLHEQPDAGMWELRTRARVHTSSSLMCWAACDRLMKIARALGLAARQAVWAQRADIIREKILRLSWNERRGAFAESFGGQDLDASVLLMCEVGFIHPQDPRFVSTVQAMEQSLCDGPFMRRYEAPDDFGRPETAFNVCSFWRIEALARIGREDEAREIFEAMLSHRNHVGLLSEDLDPRSGELWGNFPQTYSMVGIINCAVRLSRSWDSVV